MKKSTWYYKKGIVIWKQLEQMMNVLLFVIIQKENSSLLEQIHHLSKTVLK